MLSRLQRPKRLSYVQLHRSGDDHGIHHVEHRLIVREGLRDTLRACARLKTRRIRLAQRSHLHAGHGVKP